APNPTGSSFADELSTLRRRANFAPATTPPPVSAPAPVAVASAAPVPALAPRSTGQVDRDGDGRTDQWITRENGAITREEFDENFDGNPDRTLIYDPASHAVVQIEEDTNFDGRIDAWTSLRGGK